MKGNLYVSVKGGNTANTEYEFLSGDTMAFYNYGQVVYNLYINHDMSNEKLVCLSGLPSDFYTYAKLKDIYDSMLEDK